MAMQGAAKQEVLLLEALRQELEFLDSGGYSRTLGDGWRAPLIFEDSPICANHRRCANRAPCSECTLMPLVRPEFRDEKVPCRFIQLNSSGETLDHLYRHADEHELAGTYRHWLVHIIETLEALAPIADVT